MTYQQLLDWACAQSTPITERDIHRYWAHQLAHYMSELTTSDMIEGILQGEFRLTPEIIREQWEDTDDNEDQLQYILDFVQAYKEGGD